MMSVLVTTTLAAVPSQPGPAGPDTGPTDASPAVGAPSDASARDETAPPAPLLDSFQQGERTVTPRSVAERVLEVAPEADVARLRTEAARAERKRARVGLYPRLDASFEVSRLALQEGSGVDLPGVGGQSSTLAFDIPRNRASLRAGMSYSITGLLLEQLPTLEAENVKVEARSAEEAVIQRDLTLRAEETFWRLVRTRGVRWVAVSSLREARASRDRLRSMINAGLVTPADLAAGEARLEERREELMAAESNLDIAREDLALLTETPRVEEVAIPRAVLAPPSPPVEAIAALEDEARTRREDLRVLELAHDELAKREAALLGPSLPDVTFEGETLYASPNPNVVPPEDTFLGSGSVGLALSWSPNELATADADRDRLRADLARVKRQWDRTWREIRFAVRRGADALRVSLRRIDSTEARVAAAAEAYRTRQVAFENGRGLYTEVLSAEAELNRAQQAFLFALVDAHLAKARLARALGRAPGG